MRIQTLSRVVAATVASSAVAFAQANDDCAGAIAVTLGNTTFDTTAATSSPEVWPCAGTGGSDLWYSITAANTNDIRIETCGSTYDTALEAFSGTCGALVAIDCNDDFCALQSGLTISGVTAGTTYLFRVGGFNGATGTGAFDITEQAPPPPTPPNCVRTLFASNNGGNVGGGIYFDITVTQNVAFSGMLTNTSTAPGLPVGLSVYTTPGTYAGNETNMAVWTQVAEDDSTSVSAGDDFETAIDFVAPFTLAPGTYGIAIIGVNPTTGDMMDHDYTNGTGANQMAMSADGVLMLDLGTASNVGFTAPLFSPRVWNGELCHTVSSPGTNYCMANPNSTGATTTMGASGSSSVMSNDLVLEASDMPTNAFSFFITSQTQGFVANPNGSAGNLCVLGAIGRYVGPGQIQNSGGTGMVSLAIDNSMHPTPTGLVQVVSGETWNFQLWHRDSSPTGPTSNFSDGLEVTFSN